MRSVPLYTRDRCISILRTQRILDDEIYPQELPISPSPNFLLVVRNLTVSSPRLSGSETTICETVSFRNRTFPSRYRRFPENCPEFDFMTSAKNFDTVRREAYRRSYTSKGRLSSRFRYRGSQKTGRPTYRSSFARNDDRCRDYPTKHREHR